MNIGLESLRQSGRLLKAKVVAYKGGEKLLACCPYHRESTPSFAVFGNGGFHCMGCGCSGPTSELLQFLDIEAPEDFNERVSDKSLSMALEPSLLHQAYSIVLGQLTLQGAQRMALLRRGLSSANVSALEAQGYRSAPTSWGLRRMVADAVIAEMGEEIALGLDVDRKSVV